MSETTRDARGLTMMTAIQDAVEKYQKAAQTPAEQWAGDRSFYLLNLGSWLGERVPFLLDHIAAREAELAAAVRVVAGARGLVDAQFASPSDYREWQIRSRDAMANLQSALAAYDATTATPQPGDERGGGA